MKKKNISVALFIIIIITFLKTSFFAQYGFGLVDEGESLHNAQRIISGDTLYKDFFAIFPPLDNYFYAFSFTISGKESVYIPRFISSLIFSVAPVLLYLILKKYVPKAYALIPSLLFIFLDVNIERLFFFTPILLGLYLFITGIEERRKQYLFWSGFSLGIASLIRFDIPAAFLAGSILGLAFYYQGKRPWLKKITFSVVEFLLGVFIPVFTMGVWLVEKKVFGLFIENTIYKSVLITRLHSLSFPAPDKLIPHSLSLTSLNSSYAALFGYTLLAIYVFFFILLFKKRKTFWKKGFGLGVIFISGILLLPYVFGRSDFGHMIKGGLPALMLGAYLLYELKNTNSLKFKFAAWGLTLLIFLGSLVKTFWWVGFNDKKTVFGSNTLVLNPLAVKGSTLVSSQDLSAAVAFIEKNTREDEPILALPYMAGLYFLSDRPSATKFNNVLAGFIVTKKQQEDFIKRIKKAKVRVVVYAPDTGPKMKNNLLKDYNPLIHSYLMKDYEVKEETGSGWLLMIKRHEQSL